MWLLSDFVYLLITPCIVSSGVCSYDFSIPFSVLFGVVFVGVSVIMMSGLLS